MSSGNINTTGNINLDILLSQIRDDANSGTHEAVKHIKRMFPGLSDKDANDIHLLIITEVNKPKEKISLVVTAPPSFEIREKVTKVTVDQMLEKASKSITITGYAVSEYFKDAIDVIIKKSHKGVIVKFFVNKIDSQKNYSKLLDNRGDSLQIYNYSNESDAMAALHAKVISIDRKETLITSANLSYHGQEGNIELGTHIVSENIAKHLDGVLTSLIKQKVFNKI